MPRLPHSCWLEQTPPSALFRPPRAQLTHFSALSRPPIKEAQDLQGQSRNYEQAPSVPWQEARKPLGQSWFC